MATGIVRTEPRISVNKLGEYMTARPIRRRRIIVDQKRPKEFIVPIYTEAQEAISTYLTGGATDDAFLLSEIERFANASPESDWEEQRYQLSIEALESFLDLADMLELDDLTLTLGDRTPPNLQIAGVSVSVRPEVIARGTARNGEPFTGVFKLYFSKTIPLDHTAGTYVSTLVHQFVDEHIAPQGMANHRYCQVIDVFGGQVYTAPRSFIRRRRDIEAACDEIARGWSIL